MPPRNTKDELANMNKKLKGSGSCSHCNGTGYVIRKTSCPVCNGSGKQGVAEGGYQDDTQEREENLRHSRSRNDVADRIRDKLNPKSSQRWLVKIWDGNSTREFERNGSYEQVRMSLTSLPHSHIVSIEPIGQGVEEGAPDLLKAEMPLVRHIEQELAQYGYQKGTPEYDKMFRHAWSYYQKFGNVDAIKRG
jgi:hypothetical protein